MSLRSQLDVIARGGSELVPCPIKIGAQGFAGDASQGLDRRAMLGRRPAVAIEPGPDMALLDLAGLRGEGAGKAALASRELHSLFEWVVHADDNTTLAVPVNTPGCLTGAALAVNHPAMNLGQRVTAAREYAKLTQAQLAKRVGVTQQTMHKLEAGKAKRSSALADICLETGVSLRWLVRGEGSMIASQSARPDPITMAHALTVLQSLAHLQAGEATFLYDAPSLLAIYDQLSREPPDIDLDREAVLGRMAAVLRGVDDGKGVGRSDVVGAG